jgi:hypothetical protein
VKAAANTTITILRGTELDAFGDEVDSQVAAHTGVLAAIAEVGRRVFLPAENAYRVVRAYQCRVGFEADLRKDDRVRDEQSGTVYLVTELSDPLPLNGALGDRVATLSRTT